MPIRSLPKSSTVQLSSGQVLLDAASVVKELLDNALDAHATSVSIEVSHNTIDHIQVRDNGVGVLPEDRNLLGRQSCTSKVRTMDDVRMLGGSTLGFRGEALASLVAVAARVDLTTRIEGESVGVRIPLGGNGQSDQWTMVSHPPGTTVNVRNLFHALPVRKQTAQTDSSKMLAKIRTLLRSYVLARPSIRVLFKVAKSTSDKLNFSYAPAGSGANVKDAVMKLIDRDCASNCELSVFSKDGFHFEMLHPSAKSDPCQISGYGHFISIDCRPVSSRAGTIREIMSKYRKTIRQYTPASKDIKDPFLCLSITCPDGSYDPNVEPLKTDVIFEDTKKLLGTIDQFFATVMPLNHATLSPRPVAAHANASMLASAPPQVLHSNFTAHGAPIVTASRVQNPISRGTTNLSLSPLTANDLSNVSFPLLSKRGQNPTSLLCSHIEDDDESLPKLSELRYRSNNIEDERATPNAGLNPWTLAKMAVRVQNQQSSAGDQFLAAVLPSPSGLQLMPLDQVRSFTPSSHSFAVSNGLSQNQRTNRANAQTSRSIVRDSAAAMQLPTPFPSSSPLRTIDIEAIVPSSARFELSSNDSRDIRSMLPQPRKQNTPARGRRNEHHEPRGDRASTNIYNQVAPPANINNAVSLSSKICYHRIEPSTAALSPVTPAPRINETQPPMMTPIASQEVESRQNSRRSTSRARSLSRVRAGSGTQNLGYIIPGAELLTYIRHSMHHLARADVMPWFPLQNMSHRRNLVESCCQNAEVWAKTLCCIVSEEHEVSAGDIKVRAVVAAIEDARGLEMDY